MIYKICLYIIPGRVRTWRRSIGVRLDQVIKEREGHIEFEEDLAKL